MSIKQLFLNCSNNDELALETLLLKFHPLMMKMALKYGYFDEDCYQECAIAMLKSINRFSIK
ncbi:helix-turn-helix domain-containing protein [Enterococcus faecalis]